MRSATLLFVSLLLVPAAAGAKEKMTIPGGPLTAGESGLVSMAWGCDDTEADLRKKDEGAVVCLERIVLDPASGTSEAVVSVVLHDVEPDGYKLRLDSGKTERHLNDWTDAGTTDDGRTLIRFAYVTWDPAIPLEHVELKVLGKGARGAARWLFAEPVVWEGAWDAEPEVVWDEAFAASGSQCRYWDVRKKHTEDVADELSDGAASLPLALRFDAVVSDDDSEWEIQFEDHGLTFEFDDGKLVVHGREKFIRPLGDRWSTDPDDPNLVEIVYDGTWATVRVNDRAFGPIAGQRKQPKGDRFRWDFDFEDGKTRLRDLRVAPCTQPDPEKWAPPADEAPPAAVADTGAAPASAPTAASVLVGDDGRRVLAVLRPGKKKKSALEVMQTATSVATGLQSTAGALQEAGSDLKHNVDAYESGDYESMKSTDTRIEVGSDGMRVDHASADVNRTEDGATVDVEHTGGGMSWGGAGSADVPTLDAVTAAGFDVAAVCVVEVRPRARAVEVFVEGDRVGRLRTNDAPLVLVLEPGEWTITVGKKDQTVTGKAGALLQL